MSGSTPDLRRRFREEYAAQRSSEGRGLSAVDALTLPYVTEGALVRQWAVRARSFCVFSSPRRAGSMPIMMFSATDKWGNSESS